MTRGRQMRSWLPCGLALLAVAIPAVATAQPRWGRPTTPRAGACFYRDAGFRGDYFCLTAGEDLPSVPAGLNDQISSIRTFGDAEVTVYQNRRFTGRSERFPSDVRNLRNQGWNDRLSSLEVRSRSDRRGNGYGRGRDDRGGDRGDRAGDRGDRGGGRGDRRGGVTTRASAEEIVRRAYLSVLRREPDPASRGWVDKVIQEGWTEADLVRELQRSDEYRNRRP
jgi:hypothetical protein